MPFFFLVSGYYSYKIPFEFEGKAVEGCRVMVPFGNGNKKKQGFVLNIKSRSKVDESIEINGEKHNLYTNFFFLPAKFVYLYY